MKININLLSPQQRQEIHLKRIYIAIKEMTMLFLLFSVIIAILLLASKYYLENQLADLIKRNATQIKQNQEINAAVIEINDKIKTVEKIQKDFTPWSQYIYQITSLTPDEIRFIHININKDNNIINIQGVSKTRDTLLEFKKRLEESNYFYSVELPLSDLLSKTENRFNLSITASVND